MLNAFYEALYYKRRSVMKMMRIMKITAILFLVCCLQVSARVSSQGITLNVKNAPLDKVFQKIKEQTGYTFIYTETMLRVAKKVSMDVTNSTLPEALSICFASQPFTYKIINQTVVLQPKQQTVVAISTVMALPPPPPTEIHGRVVNQQGQPLQNVSVLIAGTEIGTTTDNDGRFTISVSNVKNTALEISSVGYQTKTIKVTGQTEINITLEQEVSGLNEVVIVGYGTVKKSDLTGAVASINGDQLKTAGVSSVTKALQGRLAGVQVESAGGDPGSGMRVLVRGVGTWNNNDPLYIVDGVQVENIDNLNPNDISNISVLKDASAAAIYGSRAANGVVLVTTKSGTSGKVSINMKASYGVQQLPHKLDLLNAKEYATVINAANDAAGLPHLDFFKNPDSFGVGTDWQKEIFQVAPIQNYYFGIGGGKAGSTYNVSFGYLNQEGIVKSTGYSRFNLRIKSQTTKGRFTLGETVILSEGKRNLLNSSWGGYGGNPVGSATLMIPNFKMYDSTAIGGYGGAYGPVANVGNPVAQQNLIDPKTQTTNIVIDVFAKVDLFKGLYYKLNLGYTNSLANDYNYVKRYTIGQFFNNPTNNLSEGSSRNPFMMLEHTLHYENTFGKNDIQALAGYTMQENKFRSMSATTKDLPDGISVLSAGAGATYTAGLASENTLLSLLGRIIYSYDNRYILTGTFRRDGSSRFTPENRYGNFPSIAVAWNIANERFFSSLVPKAKVSSLKLRASYGILGNQLFADYAYIPLISLSQNYVVGTDQRLWYGATQTSIASTNIKWESTGTFDIGLDAGLFDNKMSFTADYYNKKTTDVLLGVPLPGSVGSVDNPVANAGAIINQGLELALSYAGGRQFKYNINGNFTVNKNRVLSLAAGKPIINETTTTLVGGPVGAFYLIKTDGIFNSQQEVQSYKNKAGNLIQPNAAPGDIRFVDANGDGIISNADKVYRGSPFPKFIYGFGFNGSWKGIDLSMFVQGTHGNKIYNWLQSDLENVGAPPHNWSKSVLKGWTPDHHTNFPRVISTDPNNNGRASDRFLEDGSYLRMKTMELGYTFNPDVLNPAGIKFLRVYISAENLFTITKYLGYNPDLGRTGSILNRGVDNGSLSYPLSRSFILGIQLDL